MGVPRKDGGAGTRSKVTRRDEARDKDSRELVREVPVEGMVVAVGRRGKDEGGEVEIRTQDSVDEA